MISAGSSQKVKYNFGVFFFFSFVKTYGGFYSVISSGLNSLFTFSLLFPSVVCFNWPCLGIYVKVSQKSRSCGVL